jgi:hypothetical protein
MIPIKEIERLQEYIYNNSKLPSMHGFYITLQLQNMKNNV